MRSRIPYREGTVESHLSQSARKMGHPALGKRRNENQPRRAKERPRHKSPKVCHSELAESPVRTCPERSRREPAISRHHHESRVAHSSRTLRRVGFHGRIPLKDSEAPRPGGARLHSCRKPQKMNRRKQHRGRAALQRRVKRSEKQPGFSPRGRFSEMGQSWEGTTSLMPQTPENEPPQAAPWKSGASAPRKAAYDYYKPRPNPRDSRLSCAPEFPGGTVSWNPTFRKVRERWGTRL